MLLRPHLGWTKQIVVGYHQKTKIIYLRKEDFIHPYRKMIYNKKIVRTSCLPTVGISSDMSKFWLANVPGTLFDFMFIDLKWII